MKHRLSALLDGMEMTRSEHDWLEQRFDNMTAKEELLFRGAVGSSIRRLSRTPSRSCKVWSTTGSSTERMTM